MAHLDNNNCAPSFSFFFLRSMCEIKVIVFGPRYFSEGAPEEYAPSEKYRGPKQSSTIHTMTKKIDNVKLLLPLTTARPILYIFNAF